MTAYRTIYIGTPVYGVEPVTVTFDEVTTFSPQTVEGFSVGIPAEQFDEGCPDCGNDSVYLNFEGNEECDSCGWFE